MVNCAWCVTGSLMHLPKDDITRLEPWRTTNINRRIYDFSKTSFPKPAVRNLTSYLKKKFLNLTAQVLLANYAKDEEDEQYYYFHDEQFLKICTELDIVEQFAMEAMVESNWFIREINSGYWIVANNLFHSYKNDAVINDPKEFFNL